MSEDLPSESEPKQKISHTLDRSLFLRIKAISDGSKRSISTVINYLIKSNPKLESLEQKYSKKRSPES